MPPKPERRAANGKLSCGKLSLKQTSPPATTNTWLVTRLTAVTMMPGQTASPAAKQPVRPAYPTAIKQPAATAKIRFRSLDGQGQRLGVEIARAEQQTGENSQEQLGTAGNSQRRRRRGDHQGHRRRKKAQVTSCQCQSRPVADLARSAPAEITPPAECRLPAIPRNRIARSSTQRRAVATTSKPGRRKRL